jgi:hypothetical protein
MPPWSKLGSNFPSQVQQWKRGYANKLCSSGAPKSTTSHNFRAKMPLRAAFREVSADPAAH